MPKTDKSSILKSGIAKVAAAASSAKRRISRKVVISVAVVGVAAGAVAALAVFRPDLKVVDAVNAKVGIGPTFEQLKAAAAKDPKNAQLQLDLGHAAFDSGKKQVAIAAYDAALAQDPKLASDRVATNLISCFGTSDQTAAYTVITRRKLVGAEDGLRKLGADKRYVVRTNAVAALNAIGKAKKDDWMSLWILDTKEERCDIRRNAVEKLGEFGDKRALAAIKAADKKDEDQTAWYQLSCLSSRPEDAEKKILARR